MLKELQSIGLDVKILNEDQEEVVIKELDDEDEVVDVEGGIEEVMGGESITTDAETADANVVDLEEPEVVNAGEEDDVLSELAFPMGLSSQDED